MNLMLRLLVVALLPLFLSAQMDRYDVTSVKPNVSGGPSYVRPYVNGALAGRNSTVLTLIAFAFDIPEWRTDGPGWIKSERYDIDAKPQKNEGPIPAERIRRMIQSLLVDRFQFKAHQESRDLPMYALTVAKTGVKFPQAAGNNCFPVTVTTRPEDMGALPPCGSIVGSAGNARGRKVSMAQLASFLAVALRTTVLDQTVLGDNAFDLQLQWTPDDLNVAPSPTDAPGPSLFTALEQAGLKLEQRQGPLDVLVIDRIEKPQPN